MRNLKFIAQAMNSPQSQKEAVRSTVAVKTNKEIAKTTQPVRSLILLKLFMIEKSPQPQRGVCDMLCPLGEWGFLFLWQ